MKDTFSPYNATDYLSTEARIREYLKAAFESGDSKLIARAIGNVAQIKGMSNVSRATKLDRSSLYTSLTENGDPKLSTIIKVLNSFGYTPSIA